MRGPHLLLFAGLVAAVAAPAPPVGAAETTLRAELDARKIGVNDQVQLTITLEGSSADLAADIAPPPLQNLRVVAGPMVSTQVSIVNGALSQGKAVTYVLQPLKVGRAEVGAARVTVGGAEKTTAPLSLEVVPGTARPRPRQRPVDPFGEDPFERLFGRSRIREPAPKLFVRAVANRTRLYVGEPLVLTYYLYTQTSVTELQFSDPPQYPGFWSEDLDRPDGPSSGEPVTVEGERYRRFAIRQKLLFPTRAGTLVLPAAALKIGVPGGFFDGASRVVERSTEALTISADPLPEEAGFTGAVGRFRASASVDTTAVRFGEAATVRLRVEGSGNLKWIERGPELVVPGAKVYPPQVRSHLQPGAAGLTGSKTWEYVVVPETTGALEVPSLPFSYFDPQAKRIVRAETDPLPLTVEAAPGTVAPLPTAAAAPGSGFATLALRSDLDPPARWLPQPSARVLAFTAVAAVLLHAALMAAPWWYERHRAARGHATPARSLRAALSDLERAGRGGMSKEAAAGLIEKTLHELFGPMENGGGPSPERERAAREVLEEVRFLRYAPQLGDYGDKIRDVAARAAEVARRWA